MYTVYWSPKDYPGKYAVRRWEIQAGKTIPKEVQVFDGLQEAREFAGKNASACFAASPEDDKAIVETWF